MISEDAVDLVDLTECKAASFAEACLAIRTIQEKDGLIASSEHVDMRGKMVSKIDDDLEPIDSQNRRHRDIKPNHLG